LACGALIFSFVVRRGDCWQRCVSRAAFPRVSRSALLCRHGSVFCGSSTQCCGHHHSVVHLRLRESISREDRSRSPGCWVSLVGARLSGDLGTGVWMEGTPRALKFKQRHFAAGNAAATPEGCNTTPIPAWNSDAPPRSDTPRLHEQRDVEGRPAAHLPAPTSPTTLAPLGLSHRPGLSSVWTAQDVPKHSVATGKQFEEERNLTAGCWWCERI
jgi:hypothetical protein